MLNPLISSSHVMIGEREVYNIENVISDVKTFVDAHCNTENTPLVVVGHR